MMITKITGELMRLKVLMLFFIAMVGGLYHAHAQADTVLNRYREYLFRTAAFQSENIDLWMNALTEHQQWSDINYKDTERANWKVSEHLNRVNKMALAWAKPRSPYYHNEALWKAVEASLGHWLAKRYQNNNWWHNQIGVPRYMRDIIILLLPKLSPVQRRQALEVLAQHKVQGNGAGANLVWSADLGFHYGALTKDKALMEKCRDLIVREIVIYTGEGIQPDFSYHQHGNRLQMYQYGRAFLLDNVRLAWQLRETSLAFPKDKIEILTNFILKGWQWMSRAQHTVPGTMDRSVSRQGELRSADIRDLVPFLAELVKEKAADFKAIAKRQNGKGSLIGYRYYPYSDFAAYHQKDFSFFLKSVSDRTLPTESINSENLKGHLLNSGDAYLVRNGHEYFDLMPVWDWELLPGVTTFKGADHIIRRPFVGSVSNGISGLSVMDYHMENKAQSQILSAHKVWASHGGIVVCLIAGLEGKSINGNSFTALDQSRWQGEVTVNQPGNIMEEGIHHMEVVKWIHHNGFAYIPLAPSTFDLQLKEVTNAWSSINTAQSTTPITERIFMPVLVQSVVPEGVSTGYVLSACSTPQKVQRLVKAPTWKVVRNDKACQAVSFKDGTLMVAFFAPDCISFGAKKVLEVDRPCIIMISDGKLYASSPAHNGGKVSVKWNGKIKNILLKADGTTSSISVE